MSLLCSDTSNTPQFVLRRRNTCLVSRLHVTGKLSLARNSTDGVHLRLESNGKELKEAQQVKLKKPNDLEELRTKVKEVFPEHLIYPRWVIYPTEDGDDCPLGGDSDLETAFEELSDSDEDIDITVNFGNPQGRGVDILRPPHYSRHVSLSTRRDSRANESSSK